METPLPSALLGVWRRALVLGEGKQEQFSAPVLYMVHKWTDCAFTKIRCQLGYTKPCKY